MRQTLEKDIQKRIFALAILYTRAVLEIHILIATDAEKAKKENQKTATLLLSQYRDLLKSHGDIFSTKELVLLNMPFGSWTEADANNASWSSESSCVLKWAIGTLEKIPEYDTRFKAEDIENIDIERSHLRTINELNREFERGKKWNWRVAAEFLYRNRPEAYDQKGPSGYKKMVEDSANDGVRRGLVADRVDGDLKAFDKKVGQLTEEELVLLGAIAYARQKALAWIVGDFSDVIKMWDMIEVAS